jgi:3-hydroxybutyryl-CoA dehydrogenase
MAIERIAVIGAGIMGNGIAQVAASSGYKVTLRSREQATLDKALASIRNSLGRLVKSGRLEEAKADEIAASIKVTTSVEEAAADADYVFESVPEIMDLKQDLFVELDRVCKPHTILSTNTSQLSVGAIGSKTKRQDKVIGAHWFNPPAVMKLIEVVRAQHTSDETVQATLDLCRSFGKETAVCKDTQGFIVNRLLLAQRAEACRMLEEGVATVEEIDRAIELGLNHPMGPFKLADFAGLDTATRNLEGMTQAYGQCFAPAPAIKKLVEAGHLGRKNGRGFYDYSSGQPQPVKD